MMTEQEYHDLKNFRWIEKNEIVFDVDNRDVGFIAITHIACNLFNNNYGFEIYYAEGQKSPHLHLKIDGLTQITQIDKINRYKALFCLKYCPKKYHEELDLSFYKKRRSPIARENKIHFKYGTIKKLLGIKYGFNKIEHNLLKEAIESLNRVSRVGGERNDWVEDNSWNGKICSKLSILNIAESFGLSLRGNKTECPFHSETKPSLVFYDKQGKFYCFGCNKGGNIAEFVDLCKDIGLKENKEILWQRNKQ